MITSRFKKVILAGASVLAILAGASCGSTQERIYLEQQSIIIEPSTISPQDPVSTGAVQGEP